MTNEPNYLLSNTRGKLALLYGVSAETFAKWVKRHPIVNKLLNEDYLNVNILPPTVIEKVVDALGEPS